MTKSAEELEREVEQTRRHMDQTVDALSERMTPGQWLDAFVRGVRSDGQAGTLASVGRQVREQPVPLALLGVGLVWMGAGLVWLAVNARSRERGLRPYDDYAEYPDYPVTINQPGEDSYSAAPHDRGGLP